MTVEAETDGIVRVPVSLGERSYDILIGEGLVAVQAKRVYLGLNDGSVELLEVKPDGKRAMAASAWAAGLQGADLSWGVLS